MARALDQFLQRERVELVGKVADLFEDLERAAVDVLLPTRPVRGLDALGENAARFYKLDLQALSTVAERVGPKVGAVL